MQDKVQCLHAMITSTEIRHIEDDVNTLPITVKKNKITVFSFFYQATLWLIVKVVRDE